MNISKSAADDLCKKICSSLTSWDAMDAAFQCGALEDKARGRFFDAIAKWRRAVGRNDLLVLPEYRPPMKKKRQQIDFALIKNNSVGLPVLEVDTILKVKFNYASQITTASKVVGELSRLRKALIQTRAYKRMVGLTLPTSFT